MRLFAAVALAAPAREALHAWAAPVVAAEPSLRAVPAESLHLTLVFLGARPAAEVPAILQALARPPAVPAHLTLAGLAYLPSRRRPAVLVADVEPDPALDALHAWAVRALAPFHRPETRPFRPHVTLGRVRRRGPSGRSRAALPAAPAVPIATAGVALYRSHPGSRYEALG